MKTIDDWRLTDDATGQHIHRCSKTCFDIIDSVALPDGRGFVSRRKIDLAEYDLDEAFCECYLKPHDYKDPEDVINQYGDSGWQIIAECIAETEIWERVHAVFEGTQKQCRRYIDELVKEENREYQAACNVGDVRRRRRRSGKRRRRRASGK